METKSKGKKKTKEIVMKDGHTETMEETIINKKHKKKRKHEAIDNNKKFVEKETENTKGKKMKQDLDNENDMKTLSEKKMNKKHKNKNKAIHKNDINYSKGMDTGNRVKKKKKQKLDVEKDDESLLEKKHKTKRKYEEIEENTCTENVDKKKQKKVKKKQELLDNVNIEQTKSSNDKNKENTTKEKKKKKKKKKDINGDENKEETKTNNAKDSSLEYLKLWSDKRHKWKFQKVRQTWLLKHCYNKQKMPDEYFTILLRYLEGLKGRSREITIKDAEKLMQKHEDMPDDEITEASSVKCDRARQLIQLLS